MRARPGPTQLEHLSDASFLGKLLVFPLNVRIDQKVIASYKHSSLFGLMDSEEGKKFYYIGPRLAKILVVKGVIKLCYTNEVIYSSCFFVLNGGIIIFCIINSLL